MFLKLFVLSVLLYNVQCQYEGLNGIYKYQLPDNEPTKSLNVTINSESYYHFEITIECLNLDSLKHFEIRLRNSTEIELRNGLDVNLVKCFNNATDTGNYNYSLSRWFNSLPYFKIAYQTGYPIVIKLDEFAVVNGDVLYKHFDFRKFNRVTLKNQSFMSTKFLTNLYCQNCIFENNGQIDFNDFGESIAETSTLEISFNKLLNLNSENLAKWSELTSFEISDFDLDDYNTFNVPDLFQNNVNITQFRIERSKSQIILHDELFRSLKSVRSITLNGLKLDSVSKDLFNDLNELYSIYLSGNNIKMIDPGTFRTNTKLSALSFEDNPFYTESHGKLEPLQIATDSLRFEMGNFTAESFDFLDVLMKTPKVREAIYQYYLPEQFKVTDFLKIYPKRELVLDIRFKNGEPTFDLENIKTYGNILGSEYELSNDNQLNSIVNIQFPGDAICHDCTLIKYLFPHFLQRYYNRPGFFFNESRTLIEFKIPDACLHLEEHFEETFEENCPTSCTCKYSPLLDKVKIDCNNKNLTEIPHIPYPVQFKKLNSIDLYMENNSISVLTLANQDANVLKNLSTLNFKNNKIESVEIDKDVLLASINAVTLCDNPIIADEKQIELVLASGTMSFRKDNCSPWDVYPRVVDYINENKLDNLDGYLNSLKCQ